MKNYPLPNHHFQVEWGGTRIGFQEVSGLTLETEPIEYREGRSVVAEPMTLPGLKKYGDITLKRGVMAGDNEIFQWFSENTFGTTEQRDVTISLLNEEHEPVMVWKVSRAWIRKITGPTLDGQGNEVAIEEMTLSCEGISIQNG